MTYSNMKKILGDKIDFLEKLLSEKYLINIERINRLNDLLPKLEEQLKYAFKIYENPKGVFLVQQISLMKELIEEDKNDESILINLQKATEELQRNIETLEDYQKEKIIKIFSEAEQVTDAIHKLERENKLIKEEDIKINYEYQESDIYQPQFNDTSLLIEDKQRNVNAEKKLQNKKLLAIEENKSTEKEVVNEDQTFYNYIDFMNKKRSQITLENVNAEDNNTKSESLITNLDIEIDLEKNISDENQAFYDYIDFVNKKRAQASTKYEETKKEEITEEILVSEEIIEEVDTVSEIETIEDYKHLTIKNYSLEESENKEDIQKEKQIINEPDYDDIQLYGINLFESESFNNSNISVNVSTKNLITEKRVIKKIKEMPSLLEVSNNIVVKLRNLGNTLEKVKNNLYNNGKKLIRVRTR